MANNIEERIVQMKFDNARFEQGIRTSMSSLKNFDESLRSKEGVKGLTEISNGIEKVTHVSAGLIAKCAVITNVVNSAINAGKNFVKSITIDPVATGLSEYETKMGSVQTILMGTGESLDVVMDKLEELNKYADRTIYSFQDMTSNIGKFTNAGVKLDVATKAIQGVSNLAAVSGASAADASRAMYNISQALGTGYMQLMDWKSIENANMATMEFKQTLIDTAKEMGVLTEASGVTAENIRETFKDKWLTNDVLLKTLMKYTDETTELGKKAFAAATEIKTATQLFDVMGESVQSGWAVTWEHIIGNFDEAKKLFTGIGQVFDFFAGRSADARNSVLKDWKELGGRQAIIQSLYNTFANLLLIIKPFKDAFKDVFPPVTGKTLADLSKKLADFTGKIWISRDAAEGLKNILTMLLTPLKMVVNGLKMGLEVAKVFGVVLWYLSQAFLASFKNLSGFENVFKKLFGDERYTRILTAWNKILHNIQNGVVGLIGGTVKLANAISNLPLAKSINEEVSKFIGSGVDKFLDMIVNGLESMANFDFTFPDIDISFLNKYQSLDDVLAALKEGHNNLKTKIKEFFDTLSKGSGILSVIREKFEVVVNVFRELTENITPAKILIFAFGMALVSMIDKFAKVGESTSELLESFTRLTKGIRDSAKAWAFNKKATGIIKIAAAFAILAASLYALSRVDSKKLLGAAVALGVLGAELTAITFILGKFTDFGDIISVMGSLVALAASIMVMTNALKTLNNIQMSKDIWKNLGVLAVALTGFSAIAVVLSKLAPKMSGGSLFLVAFAFSVDKLVTALGKLNELRLTASDGILKEMIALMGLLGTFVLMAGRMKISSAAGIILLAATIDVVISAFNKIQSKIDLSGLTTVFDNVKSAIVKIKDFITDSTIEDLAKYAILAGSASAVLLAFGGALYFILSGINMLSKGIIRVAIAGAIVVSSLKMLDKVNPETIDNGIKVIKQLFTSMTGLAAVLGLFSGAFSFSSGEANGEGGIFKSITGLLKGTKAIAQLGKSASKIGSAMIKISVAVGLLVGVMKLMEYLDPEKMKQNLVAVEILLATFGVLVATTAFAKKAGPIITLAVIIGTLVSALALFTLVDGTELMRASTAMGIAFVSLGVMLRGLNGLDIKSALSGIVAIAGIVLSMGVLLPGLKAMGDYDWDSGIKAAGALSILAVGLSTAVRILSGIDNFKELGSSMIGFLGVAATMIGVGAVLGKFAQEFYEIDWQALIAGSVSLGIMANAFASATFILSKIKGISELGGSLISFAAIAAVMVGVAAGLGRFAQDFMTIPFDSLLSGSIALGIMVNAFAASSVVLSRAKFDSFSSMAQSLIGFVGMAGTMVIAMNLLAPAFQKMAGIPWGTLVGAGLAVSEMAIGMAAATGILAIFADFMEKHVVGMITGAGAMIAVAVAARIMAPAMEQLAGIGFWDLSKGLIALVGALGAMGVIAYLLGNSVAQMAMGLLVLGGLTAMLYLITPALKQLAEVDFVSTVGGIGALALALVALGACSFVLGSLFPQMALGAVTLAAFGLALMVLVPPLQQLATVDFVSALEGIGALSVALLALGGCSFVLSMLFPQMLIGSAVMAAFGLALMVLTPQLERVSKLDFMSVIEGIGGIAVSILALGICAGILGALFPVMAAGIIVMIGFGAAVAILGGALSLASTSVQSFSVALAMLNPPLLQLSTVNLTGTAAGLALVVVACLALGIASMAMLPASIGLVALTGAIIIFAAAIGTLNTVIEGATALGNLFQAGSNMIGELINGITTGVSDITQAALDTVSGFVNGLTDGIATIWNTGVSLGKAFIDGLRSKDGIDSHSPARATMLAASDATDGWVAGTNSGQSKVAQSGVKTANTYLDSQEKVLKKKTPEIASESVDTYVSFVEKKQSKAKEAGNLVASAQAEGMEEGSELISKTGEKNGLTMVMSMLDGFKESTPWLANGIDKLGSVIETKFGATLSNIDLSAPIQELLSRTGVSDLMSMFGIGGEEGEDSGMDDMFSDMTAGFDSVSESSSKAEKEVEDAIYNMKKNIMDGMDIFSKFDDTVDITTEDMIVNLQSQLDGVSKWSKDLHNLTAKGFDEGFIQTLAEKGTAGYKYVEALQTATAEQIFTYNMMYLESTKSANAAIEFVKSALPTLTAKVAEETGKTVELVGYAVDESGAIVDVTNEIATATEDVVDPLSEATEAFGTEAEAMEELSIATEETIEVIEHENGVIETISASIEDLAETTEEVTEAVATETETLEELSDGISEVQEGLDDTSESTEELGDTILLTTDQAMQFVKGMAKIDSELATMRQSLKETITDQINIFEKFDNESSVSKDELLANMKSQLDGVANWANNINALFDRGINEGLLAHLREMGPESAQYTKAFLEMTDAELAQAGQMYQQSLVLPDTVAQSMTDKMKESGKYSVQGLLEGIVGMQEAVYNAGAETATSYNTGYTEAEQIHSPSLVQFNNGVNDAQGLINGLNSMRGAISNTGRAMGYALVNNANGFKSVADKEDFFRLGINIDQGLIDGIAAMTDAVAAQAASMARAAYKAACAELDINSPSGMFENIGMYSDIGFANGLRGYAGVVEESSKLVGETALNSMRDSINKLSDYAISDIDDPVIRPILDLSEIQNGVRDVNSLFNKGINATTSIATDSYRTMNSTRDSQSNSDANSLQNSGASTYNFVQNNYSPKALDRITIYRQTNNQFGQLKGLVEGK